jgi:acetyl-CoA acetyltransferase
MYFDVPTDAIALHDRKDMAWLASTEKAGELAYQQAGIGPSKLSMVEVHDCFTIAEVMVGGTGASTVVHIFERV